MNPKMWSRIFLRHQILRIDSTVTDIMNNNVYVVYNNQYKVLICKHHEYAVTAKSIVCHFREKHDLTKEAWQEIINYASQYTIIDAKNLSHPMTTIAPIPYLKIIEGYSCEYHGDTICGTFDSVKQHCKQDHEWKVKEGMHWRKTLSRPVNA